MEPTLLVVVAASGAALAAAAGVVPLLGRPRPPITWLAWANALAAGMMLAAAFALVEPVPRTESLPFALGAALGIGFLYATRALSQTRDLPLNELENATPEYGYEVLLVASLHSAAEGVAIGAAMASEPAFGIFVALTLAVHNIPEGTVLAAVFRAVGVGDARAATVAVVANLGQVVMAVATFVLVVAAPAALPWALGFAAGALIFLVAVDLLPDSYAAAGPTSIALTVILAMWLFGLMHGVLRG
jgi:ZIP family zinc transporter